MMDRKYFNAAVVKAELDNYVLGQDEGVRRVALGITSHLYRIDAHKRNKKSRIRKDNMMIAGPTGCGKTETFRVLQQLEEKLGVPVIMRSAPDYIPNNSWKGEKDLVWLVRDLYTEAAGLYRRLHGAVCTKEEVDAVCSLASNGIILLDEFDKMRVKGDSNTENFCRDYQATLLKMTEGSEYVAGTVNLDDDDEDPYEVKVDTSGVMFVFLGAFEGMEKITRNRLLQEMRKKEGGKSKEEAVGIGFTAELKPAGVKADPAGTEELPAGTDLTPNLEDMIEYGIMRELAGRIAIRVNYKALSVANLVKIMKTSKTSVYHEYQERFENMGHKLTLDNAALEEIARMTADKKTGARGLSNVFNDLLSGTMFILSGTTEPMECLLRGSDIKANRQPQLRKLNNSELKQWWRLRGA